MKYCSNCGAGLSDDTSFCTNCGNDVRIKPAANNAFNTGIAPGAGRAPVERNVKPAVQLKTNRGLLKYILLSIITLGIYGIVVKSSISTDINIIASRYDGRKTMHYCLVYFIFSWLTIGILPIVWYHKLSGRIGRELRRRGNDYSFGAGTFWLWNILGAFILVGPFIYHYKLFKSMNLLSKDYNMRG